MPVSSLNTTKLSQTQVLLAHCSNEMTTLSNDVAKDKAPKATNLAFPDNVAEATSNTVPQALCTNIQFLLT